MKDDTSANVAQNTTNEAAERLRGGLEAIRDTSTDSASRQLAESLLALLETHDAAERHRAYAEGMDDGRLVEQAACREKVAAERRATVERMLAHYGLPGTEDSIADVYRTMGLDEAAR